MLGYAADVDSAVYGQKSIGTVDDGGVTISSDLDISRVNPLFRQASVTQRTV